MGVPGDAMQRRFDRPEVKVGDVDAITGKQDNVPYFIWGMKVPDYVMRMMATRGPLGSTYECRETKRRCTEGDRDVECQAEIPIHVPVRLALPLSPCA